MKKQKNRWSYIEPVSRVVVMRLPLFFFDVPTHHLSEADASLGAADRIGAGQSHRPDPLRSSRLSISKSIDVASSPSTISLSLSLYGIFFFSVPSILDDFQFGSVAKWSTTTTTTATTTT